MALARIDIHNLWDGNMRIAINENFKELYNEYIGAGLNAAEAREKALSAVMKSDDAMALSERTQKELSQAILEGDSSPLGGQLSVGADGTVYSDPQDRFVKEMNSVNQNLAQNVQKLKNENANAEVALNIPTYYSRDNHVVHPSVKYFDTKKYGYNWVQAFTPYSEGRDFTENPSVVVSDDGHYWYVPYGLTNPLVNLPVPVNTHYSDTELVDNGTELEMWYRYTDKTKGQSQIWRRKTKDCVTWTAPELIFDFGQNGENNIMSPTVVYEAGKYKVWYRNNSGTVSYVESTDLKNWSAPQICTFDYGSYENHTVWHLQISKIDGIYMAMMNVRLNDVYKLFYFKSTDGKKYYDAKLLLEPTYSGWDNDMIYRACIVKYGSWHYIYYSARSKGYQWYIGLTKAPTAFDLDGLVGVKASDLVFVEAQSGVNKKGKGSLEFLNAGVGAVHAQPTKADTLTILNGGNFRRGFLDSAGMYLDTDDNGTIRSKEKALYTNATSRALNYYYGGATQEYARFISFQVNADGGNGVLIVNNGGDFIDKITSESFGILITFKNMYGNKPEISWNEVSSTGLTTVNSSKVGFIYQRNINNKTAEIGLKESRESTGHIPLSNVSSGGLAIKVFF